MKGRTTQETKILNLIEGVVGNLPNEDLCTKTVDYYFSRRERFIKRNMGFIFTQVPYVDGNDSVRYSDIVLYIPKVIDVRIECKMINSHNRISRMQLLELNDFFCGSTVEKNTVAIVEGDACESIKLQYDTMFGDGVIYLSFDEFVKKNKTLKNLQLV